MVECRTYRPIVFVTLPTKKRTVKLSRGKQNGLCNNLGAFEGLGHGWRIQTSCHCTRIFLDHINDLFNFHDCILERLPLVDISTGDSKSAVDDWSTVILGDCGGVEVVGMGSVAGVPGVPGWPGSRELRGSPASWS